MSAFDYILTKGGEAIMASWQIWLAAAILLATFEVMTMTLICLWLAIGSLAASALAFFGHPFWMQCAAFFVLSGVMLCFTKKLGNLFIKDEDGVKSNVDRLIGEKGIVLETTTKTSGLVKLQGEEWSARSSEVLGAGTEVEVLEVQGVKLIVKGCEF